MLQLPVTYNHLNLDFVDCKRDDLPFISSLKSKGSTKVLFVDGDNVLLNNKFELPTIAELSLNKKQLDELIFVGLLGAKKSANAIMYYPANYSTNNGFEWLSVRNLLHNVSAEMMSLFSLALSLNNWYQSINYCSKCSNFLQHHSKKFAKYCPFCDQNYFPRINPAVIMLVEYADKLNNKCLLARHNRLPSGMFSTLAGFVDVAESIEQTVVREVMEEVNLKVINLKYIGSQTWSFSSSIMLGFIATVDSLNHQINKNELNSVKWFEVGELLQFGQPNSPYSQLRLSREDSIARYLINYWIKENA